MHLEDWLDDLCVRFIINLPPEELQSVERICFQVEEAQWFYEDFIRPLDPSLPSLSLRAFSLRIFQHCPLFSQWSAQHHTTAFAEFLAYKSRVPVRGAIMLNEAMDEVVLVKGWKKGANWSFPRGKINKDENDLDCAVREVYEETGFDIRTAGLVKDERDMKYIEVTMREQHMRLYVFRGVPRDAHFEPKTRKEISKIEWYKLTDLPTLKKNRQHEGSGTDQPALNANKFYMVAPFLNPLKKWIAQQRKKDNRYSSHLSAPPMVPEEATSEDDQDVDGLGMGLPVQAPQITSDLPEVSVINPTSQLKQMLNIGSTQPALPKTMLQPSHMAHVDGQKSNALLALLRNAPQGQTRPIPQTPFEQISEDPQVQQSPHVSHVRQPQLDQTKPPPPFQPQPQNAIQPSLYQHRPGTESPAIPASRSTQWQPPQMQGAPYQQTGDPQFARQSTNQTQQPSVPPASALPKLTNHTKALLDVFRGAPNLAPPQLAPAKKGLLELLSGGGSLSQPVAPPQHETTTTGALPDVTNHREYTNVNNPGAPRSLLPEASQQAQEERPTMATRALPVDARKTSLLGLFTKPVSTEQTAVDKLRVQQPAELAATHAPSPARQSLDGNKNELLLAFLKKSNENGSSKATTTAATATTKPASPRTPREGETSATISGPLNQPEFDAVSRAARNMSNDMGRSPLTSTRTLYDPNRPTPMKILTRSEESRQQQQPAPSRSPRGMKAPAKRTMKEKPGPKAQAKPFQPQILRRPQTAGSSEPESMADEARNQHAVQVNAIPSPPPAPTTPGSGRQSMSLQSSQTEAQKQTLLSLFGGGQDTTPRATTARSGSGIVSPLSSSQVLTLNGEAQLSSMEPISTRTSRVGSLASIASGPVINRVPSEKRQTGAENKAFLLGYLGRIASQESQ
ncbi:mRNA-decapping enzyme subunit 2 [Exophiala xenobiotica]|uniref:mRNA-decapping enzyme subunit 2 n=1 Tax=Vermiconidia calcicola TaxID=1690605 RepID=A0AAV9QC27_9PEZI|nr:mRNA-decapping enzyme subunit 2 [Exophiala xenobiotica]KAK5531692.1 mRNA-decapping enzyme subunit 2 [Chaetothyriales sp. CCFEE 6169]KAK5539986.1 mRNA-decapping enzyme subunit 2 [Vermiconidia calcicola]KAK5304249.1 mRNA-decapping enzyme subunit 2 [Exophiala xenobiotica]KAK5338858.1 mRNA-decapping enzyme subunit 2 [Exophiala xenobiotica]